MDNIPMLYLYMKLKYKAEQFNLLLLFTILYLGTI